MKDGELSVLLASDSSMKKDEAVGQGDGARGSNDTNPDGDTTLLWRFLSSRRSDFGSSQETKQSAHEGCDSFKCEGTPLIIKISPSLGAFSCVIGSDGKLQPASEDASARGAVTFSVERRPWLRNLCKDDRDEDAADEDCVITGVEKLRTWDDTARRPEWKKLE